MIESFLAHSGKYTSHDGTSTCMLAHDLAQILCASAFHNIELAWVTCMPTLVD